MSLLVRTGENYVDASQLNLKINYNNEIFEESFPLMIINGIDDLGLYLRPPYQCIVKIDKSLLGYISYNIRIYRICL